MGECIEREALIEKLRTMPIPKQAGRANTWLDNCAAGVNAAIREVASFPAADVAPVVRCKDCVHWDDDPDTYGADYGPKGKCMKSFETMRADDFCSYGARKDGGAE